MANTISNETQNAKFMPSLFITALFVMMFMFGFSIMAAPGDIPYSQQNSGGENVGHVWNGTGYLYIDSAGVTSSVSTNVLTNGADANLNSITIANGAGSFNSDGSINFGNGNSDGYLSANGAIGWGQGIEGVLGADGSITSYGGDFNLEGSIYLAAQNVAILGSGDILWGVASQGRLYADGSAMFDPSAVGSLGNGSGSVLWGGSSGQLNHDGSVEATAVYINSTELSGDGTHLYTPNAASNNEILTRSGSMSTSSNKVFASPSGTNGSPLFRSLTFSDLAISYGTTSNTVAQGNDPRIVNAVTNNSTNVTLGLTTNSTLPVATSTFLGAVKPDNLTITNTSGVIKVSYGTVTNTAAQGNDSRITGALQAHNAGSPTIAIGAGANGTGSSISITGSDVSGVITVTAGASAGASATICTVTFNTAYGTAPNGVVITPWNSSAALLSGATMVRGSGVTSTNFTITSGTSALTPTVQYQFFYQIPQQ